MGRVKGACSIGAYSMSAGDARRSSTVEIAIAFRCGYAAMGTLRHCPVVLQSRTARELSYGATNLTSQGAAWQARAGDVLTIVCDCKMWLAAGDFFLTLGAAHLHDGAKIDFVEDAIQFRVVGTQGAFTTALVNLESEIVISSEREDVARVGGAVGGC